MTDSPEIVAVPLPPGQDVDSLLPPELLCPLVTLSEAGEQSVSGEHCLCLRVVSMEEHITWAKYRVAENRLRCVLECVMSGERAWCWMFGPYR